MELTNQAMYELRQIIPDEEWEKVQFLYLILFLKYDVFCRGSWILS